MLGIQGIKNDCSIIPSRAHFLEGKQTHIQLTHCNNVELAVCGSTGRDYEFWKGYPGNVKWPDQVGV